MKSKSTPPKERSTTRSSPSRTSSDPANARLSTPVQFIKGVGPKLGQLFNARGIQTVEDLFQFFPRTYEDRTRLSKVVQLVEGEKTSVSLKVDRRRVIPIGGMRRRFGGRQILEVSCSDETGSLKLKYFHFNRSLPDNFAPGNRVIVTGTPKIFRTEIQMIHPEVAMGEEPAEESAHRGRIVPVYTEIEGISTRVLRKVLWNAIVDYGSDIVEQLPLELVQRHQFPLCRKAIEAIHFPPPDVSLEALARFETPAHHRLIYEEFLRFECVVLKKRMRRRQYSASPVDSKTMALAMKDIEARLPFQLTNDQRTALREIEQDLAAGTPMNRLVQGDVGSGKTVVSFLAAAGMIAQGAQVAVMGPTEILAEQHYQNAVKLFGTAISIALLTGKTTTSDREELIGRLASGQPMLVIGTHALIEDPIRFKCLQLVMIDEQHRFGVDQRRKLWEKGVQSSGSNQTYYPHRLVLTATPIPRTLALTAFGDLSVSTIRELPPGRTPILTKVFRPTMKKIAYEEIKKELQAGHQAYFVFALVDESESETMVHVKSATQEFEKLKDIFSGFKMALLHGQMKPQEKAAVMAEFRRGAVHVLVSTTVIEVGVDVPNATVMAIENAERFGLSQLHQLRGRVGRGKWASRCLLLPSEHIGETTAFRLATLERTNDGFEIAEADLELRGPGEFLGTRQSGALPFKIAQITRDAKWLVKARNDALELIQAKHPFFEGGHPLQFTRYLTS